MKRLLSIISAISLVGTSTLGIVSCEEPKCENKIIGNLKEICSSNKPFHNDDNKWYFVVVKGDNTAWNIIKFQNNNKPRDIFYISNEYDVSLAHGKNNYPGLVIWIKKDDKKFPVNWGRDNNEYFKNVYQWLGDNEPTNEEFPKIDENGNIIV